MWIRGERLVHVRIIVFGLIGMLALAAGCRRTPQVEWVSSEAVQALDPALQERIHAELTRYCGTPLRPKLLGRDDVDPRHLQLGGRVYQRRCAGCHGDTGDGNGPAAAAMYPRPRDYRRGIFKFTSTPNNARPRREDLVRIVREGAKGTAMPAFDLLAVEEIEAVVDYVLVLTHRGELEVLLALGAEARDEVDPEATAELVDEISGLWRAARTQVVYPLTRMPPYSEQTVEKGKQAFLSATAECFKCHGPDGRGQTAENIEGFKDAWGFQTRAADLTSGMFHGGNRPEDIYRRIFAGISGTPMPTFKDKLGDQPDTIWHLVHYVQYISAARRREVAAQNEQYEQRIRAAAEARMTNGP